MADDINNYIKLTRLNGLPTGLRRQIREARIKRGFSQRMLASAAGLTQSHISGIEAGKIVPRFDTLLDLVRLLEFDLLLVPRSLVPVVQSLIRASKESARAEKPLYAADEDTPKRGIGSSTMNSDPKTLPALAVKLHGRTMAARGRSK